MTRLPDAVVGSAYTTTAGWSVLEDIVALEDRMAGTDGEAEAARVLADAFEDRGCRDVAVETFEMPGWWRGDASLSVGEPWPRAFDAPNEVVGLPGTPAGEVTAPLVDVGTGTEEEFDERDVEGAVALVSSRTPDDHDRWLHRMEKYVAAAEAGAAGFVFRNHVEGCLPPTGEVGYHARPGPIPAVGVSAEVGAGLERRCEKGDPEVTLSVDCETGTATSRNVEAVVGPDETPEVLVTAHLDAHDVGDGANDNGAGCALLTEVARLLGGGGGEGGGAGDGGDDEAVDLDARVRLVAFGAEEAGLHGAYHYAETRDLEDVKCVVNVDGAATSRSLRLGTSGFEALGEAVERAMDDLDRPVASRDHVSPHGDQWAFVERGVPSVMASAASEGTGRGWGHTHADTLDKLDSRDLRAMAVNLVAVVAEVASDDTEVERADPEEIRERLDEGYVTELKEGGRWNF